MQSLSTPVHIHSHLPQYPHKIGYQTSSYLDFTVGHCLLSLDHGAFRNLMFPRLCRRWCLRQRLSFEPICVPWCPRASSSRILRQKLLSMMLRLKARQIFALRGLRYASYSFLRCFRHCFAGLNERVVRLQHQQLNRNTPLT